MKEVYDKKSPETAQEENGNEAELKREPSPLMSSKPQ